MRQISDEQFEAEVLNSDLPVVVFCYADWAGPCNLIRPDVEAASEMYGNSLKVVAINIEDDAHYAHRYQVRGVPALLLFRAGELVGSIVGAISSEKLADWLVEKGAV